MSGLLGELAGELPSIDMTVWRSPAVVRVPAGRCRRRISCILSDISCRRRSLSQIYGKDMLAKGRLRLRFLQSGAPLNP